MTETPTEQSQQNDAMQHNGLSPNPAVNRQHAMDQQYAVDHDILVSHDVALESQSVVRTSRSGVLIVDKPQGVTSHDVVAAVRSMLHIKKVGHAGTLDPMATGALVIGFGHATRLLNYIVDHDKTYEATIRLGQSTTTDDADGEVLAPSGTPDCRSITREHIEQVIDDNLVGNIEQVPSTYSAIKVDGKRAYDLARSGQEVHLQPRPVSIESFTVTDMRRTILTQTFTRVQPKVANGDSIGDVDVKTMYGIDIDVTVTCSAGTYIRSLARDLGALLEVGGHLTRLRRTRVGDFRLDPEHTMYASVQSRTFTNMQGERITRNKAILEGTQDDVRRLSLSMAQSARQTMPVVSVDIQQAQGLRYGRRIALSLNTISAAIEESSEDVVAILEPVDASSAKPITVFPAG